MNTATLTWNADSGFRLDLDGTVDSVTVRFMGVTVPADGTDALRSGPIGLFDMDMMFNTHIDVGDAPGQLHDAKVQLDGAFLVLAGELEDAETGQQEAWSVRLPVTVPAHAPAAGGPVAAEPVEDDLDWDDETAEAPKAKPAGSAAPSDEGGLEALLRSLMAGGGPTAGDDDMDEPDDAALAAMEAEEDAEEDEDDDGDEDDAGLDASLLAALLGGGVPAEDDAPGLDLDHARNLLQLLVDREGLALEPGFTVDDLAAGATPILESNKPAAAMAAALADFLLSQDAVEELYIDDESLEALLEQW